MPPRDCPGFAPPCQRLLCDAERLRGETNNWSVRFWATLRLGDVAVTQGKLSNARQLYETATEILEPFAKGALLSPAAQSDLADLRQRIGDVLRIQGDLSSALNSYRASLANSEHLAWAYPSNVGFQHQLVIGQPHRFVESGLRLSSAPSV